MAWQLYGVLHNLDVEAAFEAGWIAVVGHADARLRLLAEKSAATARLISTFTDQFGRAKKVSALIYDDEAPEHLRVDEIVRGFHRIFAISSLTNGTAQVLRGRDGGFSVRHSSLFDLYPIFPSRDGKGLVTSSAAVKGYDEPQRFKGQTSPYLFNHPLLKPDPDRLLRDRLIDVWTRYGASKRTDVRLGRVLRSLDMAYQAASLALDSSAYEYGARVALWVSAVEILAHPGTRTGNVNLGVVVDLIETVAPRWRDDILRGRRYALRRRGAKKARRVSFASRLYQELYRARNDFLHGNPVKATTLSPFGDAQRPGLHFVAPLIFEVALLGRLEQIRDRRMRIKRREQEMQDLWEQTVLEEALLKIHSRA
jgi:hypothetical protein